MRSQLVPLVRNSSGNPPDLDGALQNVVGVQLLQVVDEKYKTPALTIVRRASPMQLEAHPVQGQV